MNFRPLRIGTRGNARWPRPIWCASASSPRKALLLAPDGSAERRAEGTAPVADAALLGRTVGAQLRRDAGPEFGPD